MDSLEVLAYLLESQAKRDSWSPTERHHPRAVEQFPRSSIRLARVEDQAPAKSNHIGDNFGQLADRDFFPGPDVNQRSARTVDQLMEGSITQFHQK